MSGYDVRTGTHSPHLAWVDDFGTQYVVVMNENVAYLRWFQSVLEAYEKLVQLEAYFWEVLFSTNVEPVRREDLEHLRDELNVIVQWVPHPPHRFFMDYSAVFAADDNDSSAMMCTIKAPEGYEKVSISGFQNAEMADWLAYRINMWRAVATWYNNAATSLAAKEDPLQALLRIHKEMQDAVTTEPKSSEVFS